MSPCSLTRLLAEPDMSVWNTAFKNLGDPTDCDVVTIVFDRGPPPQTCQIRIPRHLEPAERAVVVKYLAVHHINNRVVLRGAKHIYISPAWYEVVKHEVEQRCGQIFEMMRENFGTHAADAMLPMRPNATPSPLPVVTSPPQPVRQGGIALGIDIGNTTTKIVILDEADHIRYRGHEPTQIAEQAEPFLVWLGDRIENAMASSQLIPERIGIAWFGDVRDGRALLQAAALRHFAQHEHEAKQIESMAATLEARFQVPTALYGDSEAVGIYLARVQALDQVYFLIFGTSIGGGYVSEGALESGFNLVSRIVIDMSDEAYPHEATGTRGVLQQYAASRGMQRFLRNAWPSAIEDPFSSGCR